MSTLIKQLITLSFILNTLFSPTLALASTATDEDQKTVALLLWRGITDAERGFMDYLNRTGNVKFVYLDAEKDKNKLNANIKALNTIQPDLVYTFGTTVTRTLIGTEYNPTEFSLNGSTPSVFSIVTDPVGSKLVGDKNEHSRNFTGVSHIVPHTVQLKAIKQLNHVKKIGVLFNPQEDNSVITANKLHLNSFKHKMRVHLYPFSITDGKPDISSLQSNLKRMKEDNIDLVYLPPDSFVISNSKVIVSQIHDANLMTFSATESPIRKNNALLGIVSRYYNVGQFAGYKAKQILFDHINVKDIPIEAMSEYSYIVNMNAAKKLDYYPPVSILKMSELIGDNQ
ncbi:ABC transporter substrate-binding protein [Vibrio sp.]|nr:ABC transporter substrate-binding protein [Vibrio sp.]